MNTKVNRLRSKILPLLKHNGVVKAGIFGSFARGEEKKGSDIDILIQFKGGKTLLDLVSLERELKIVLGRNVDLLTYDSINHLIKERILNEEVRVI